MATTYSELVTQIRNYTEVDSNVLSDTIVNDFIEHAGDGAFPLPWCSHRWLENINVAQRAIDMIDRIKKFVRAVERGKMKDPKTKSYGEVASWIHDPLCKAKLHFFIYLALPVEKFLTLYQTEKPMIFLWLMS